MNERMHDFWVIGLFFFAIGGFIGFLLGFSPTGVITGSAIDDPALHSCFDADGGVNVMVFGYAVDDSTRYFDNCKDDTYLLEAHCNAGNVNVAKVKCPLGCNLNRCVE